MSSFRITDELSEIYNTVTLLETRFSSTDTISSSGTIDLNNNIIIVNNLVGDINLTLPTPDSNQQNNIYSIQTLYMSGGVVTVNTNLGTFKLDASNNYVNLIYLNNQWMKINSDNTSFYPTTKQQKISPTDNTGNSLFGLSVTLSADGNTLAIGGGNDNSSIGAIWVYTRTGGVWVKQKKISPAGGDYIGAPLFGYSVSLSADGNTLAIGGPGDTGNIGATWVYTRTGGVWTRQRKISPAGGDYSGPNPSFGYSVSLSTNGNSLAIGGIGDNGIGATLVYTRTGGVWARKQKISPAGDDYIGPNPSFGNSVTLSEDGNTLVIGGIGDNSDIGAIWVYTRTGDAFVRQQKLSPGDNIGNSKFGNSVSLSANGNSLAIGGPSDTGNIGATWVYTRTGGVWVKQQKISSGDNIGNSQFGYSVTLSADGNSLAIGGIGDNGNIGATWVYTRTGGVWVRQRKISPAVGDFGTNPAVGYSVSLSANGNSLAIGGPSDAGNIGAIWVYV